jgi:hypothetical protein
VMFSKSSWDTNVVGSDKVDIQLPGEYNWNVDGHYWYGLS